MKILVYPHDLIIGGCQINAIDLAAEMRGLGHEAIIYAQPGPLERYITGDKGLRYVPANDSQVRPGPRRVWELARLAKRERIDIVHAYEWPTCLDAYYGAHLVGGVPVLCTVLSMGFGFTSLVPSTVPLLIGTHQQAEQLRAMWPGRVEVMEPPIDVVRDHPSNDGSAFRRTWSVGDQDLLVVSVSRLSVELKLDSLKDAIDGVGAVADRYPVRLLLVGEGEAARQLSERAAAVNAAAGREVVTLTGAMLDPRPAYAAADVMLGQGSSALRAMAHGKPLIVNGEKGFARIFDRDSAPDFGWTGFGGNGDGTSGGPLVAAALEVLLSSPSLRSDLGRFGLETVRERYSLRAAAERLEALYAETIAAKRSMTRTLRQAATTGRWAFVNEARLHMPSHQRRRREQAAAKLALAGGGSR